MQLECHAPIGAPVSRRSTRLLPASMLLAALVATGCASTPTSESRGSTSVLSFPAEPLAPGLHTLSVRGMSCPKCVSNVDMQLKRLPGITKALVDMKHGTVVIEVAGADRPTARQIANAVEDAGFTLASIDAAEAGR